MRTFYAWLLVRPAEDVPNQWVAHCLDFDVVTYGNSISHAMKMAMEACSMVIDEDVVAGRDPYERRAAEECFEHVFDTVTHGERIHGDPEDLLDDIADTVAAQVRLVWRPKPMHEVPVLWRMHDPEQAPRAC